LPVAEPVTEAELPVEGGAGGKGRLVRALRLLPVLLLLIMVALLLLGAAWFIDPSVTPLRVARIEGDLHHLKRAQLEQAVSGMIRDGFFSVDVQAVKQAAEALPWVARASVRRVWPDTLHLWVVEQSPLARWGDEGVLNQQGEVFRPAPDSIPAGLPWLHGPEDSGAEVAARYRLARELLARVGMDVVRLELSGRRAWRLQTRAGMTVELGQQGFRQRIETLLKVYPQLRDSRTEQMQRIDMRHRNGMAILWVAGSAAKKAAS
jgi:cell division protein FtsQ